MFDLIVPIAGRSSRFSGVTNKQKWELEVAGRSILRWAVESITHESTFIQKLVFVVLAEHMTTLEADLSLWLPSHLEVEICQIASVTSGQAETVARALPLVRSSEASLLVWNGDSALLPGWSSGVDLEGNFLLLSELQGDHWSFAKLREGQVEATAEKKRISPYASLGLYGFSSAQVFEWARKESEFQGEAFVAPLYNSLISVGDTVRGEIIEERLFLPFGTPQELKQSCERLETACPLVTDY